MPFAHNYVVDEILVPVVFLFLLVSGLFGVGLGAGIAVFGQRILSKAASMNRWVSVRKNIKPMEVAHDIEPFIHKYRRQFAALFIIGGVFTIFMLAAKVDAMAVASVFGARKYSMMEPWIVQSLTTFLIVGSVLAVVIGIILGFFPRVLAALETHTNHWYSSRQVVRGADKIYLPLDRWFQHSPRVAGGALAVLALVLTVIAATVLAGRF